MLLAPFPRPMVQLKRSSLSYAITHLPIPPSHLIARIGSVNNPSIRLFHSLGFATVKTVEVWDEVEIRFGWDETTGTQRDVAWDGPDIAKRIGVFDEGATMDAG